MKKIIIVLIATIMLSACGNAKENPLPLPKISFATSPEPTNEIPSIETPKDISGFESKMSMLKIMDTGYNADSIASIGDTILAADVDSSDYEVVLASVERNTASGISITSRKILLASQENTDATDDVVYGVSAGFDGNYYVLTGQRPAIYYRSDAGEFHENEEYSGMYSIQAFSQEGTPLNKVEISGFPADTIMHFVADRTGKLMLVGGMSEKNPDDPFYGCITGVRFIRLDLTGQQHVIVAEGDYQVNSICSDGDNIVIFIDNTGFFVLNEEKGLREELEIECTRGGKWTFDSPFCCQTGTGKILINNHRFYGSYDFSTDSVHQILASSPSELSSEAAALFAENMPVQHVYSCVSIYENVFLLSTRNSESVYLLQPKNGQ